MLVLKRNHKIVIVPDFRIPKYVPLFGWKRKLSWFFKREICFIVEGNIAYCHPENFVLLEEKVLRRK